MSDILNNNVIASGIKFVDFAGLDHFWSIAKAYINAEDAKLKGDIDAVADVVGNDESGLVKDVKVLQAEVAALGGVEGGIQGMIDASIDDLVNNGAVKTNTDAIATLTQTVADNKAAIEGTVAGVEEKVDNHIADAVTHITADERTSWNEAKKAIDTFLKDAELDAEEKSVIDTLKELQEYVGSDPAATKLIERVSNLESNKADKTYVDGAEYKAQFDAAGSATTAAGEVKTYVDGEAYKAQFDAAGSAATAKSEAISESKAYVDGAEYKAQFDAAGSANAAQAAAESNANAYTDALANSIVVASLSDIDSIFGVTDHNHEA